jgi:hypothetical protein
MISQFIIMLSGFLPVEVPVIDSKCTFEQALQGKKLPPEIKKNLILAEVEYYSYDGRLHKGQLVVNKAVLKDILAIFSELKNAKFPVKKVIPIALYDWDDSLSMLDNNTSCFNYRKVSGARVMSKHATGDAIDINPMQNPHIKRGLYSPANARYIAEKPGTITRESAAVKIFKKYGWRWGGQWLSSKDYQHFEK